MRGKASLLYLVPNFSNSHYRTPFVLFADMLSFPRVSARKFMANILMSRKTKSLKSLMM